MGAAYYLAGVLTGTMVFKAAEGVNSWSAMIIPIALALGIAIYLEHFRNRP